MISRATFPQTFLGAGNVVVHDEIGASYGILENCNALSTEFSLRDGWAGVIARLRGRAPKPAAEPTHDGPPGFRVTLRIDGPLMSVISRVFVLTLSFV